MDETTKKDGATIVELIIPDGKLSFNAEDIIQAIGETLTNLIHDEVPELFEVVKKVESLPEQERKKLEEKISNEVIEGSLRLDSQNILNLLGFLLLKSPLLQQKLTEQEKDILKSITQENVPEEFLKIIETVKRTSDYLRLSLLTPVKEYPELPKNAFFMNLQKISEGKTVLKKGAKETTIEWGEFIPQNAFEKALYVSIYLGLASYCSQLEGEIKQIRLTDLMNNIGYPKKGTRYGYLAEQKKQALEMVWKVAQTRVRIGYPYGGLPPIIRDLFPDAKRTDSIIYEVQAFDIETVQVLDKKGKLKDAIINFKPKFRLTNLYTKKNTVLSLSLKDPEYKNLAIFLSYGKDLTENAEIETSYLLNIIELQPDIQNPKRTYQRLKKLLEKAKEDKYIKDFTLQRPDFKKGWLERWLNGVVEIRYR